MGASRIQGITIQIGGDTSSLNKALQSVNKDITSTSSKLKDVNRLLKLDPKNTTLLAQKQSLLKTKIEDTKNKLSTLKEADKQAKAQLDSGDLGKDKYDALQREIAETESELKNLNTQVNQMDWSNLSGNMQEAGQKLTSAGKALMPLTAGLTAIGTVSVKASADFGSGMSQVQATLGITKDSMTTLNGETVNAMDALTDFAKELGENTAFSATEAADAINTLAQSGLSVQEIYDTLPSVMNLAAAGNISIADASTYVTASIKGFGDSMSNASVYADMLAKGATLANTDVSALGTAFSGVSATASNYGQTQEGVTESLLRLAEANITGSEAATGLSAAMTRVYAPTDQAKAAMDALGVSAYDSEGKARNFNDVVDDLSTAMGGMSEAEANAAAKTIFGSSRLAIFNDMAGVSKEKVDAFKDGLNGAGGAAENMAQTQLDNLNGKFTLLKSSAEGMAITIGDKLSPYIEKLANSIKGVTDWFNGLSDKQQDTIVKIGLVVAAIAPLLTILGTAISVIGTIVGAVSTFISVISAGGTVFAALAAVFGALNIVIVAVIAAIAAIIAIGVLLYKNWDKIKAAAASLGSKIAKAFSDLKSKVISVFNNIKDKTVSVWNNIKTAISTPITSAVNLVKQRFNIAKNFVFSVIRLIYNKVKSTFNNVKTAMEHPIKTAIDRITKNFNTFKSLVTHPIQFMKNLKLPKISWTEKTVLGKTYKLPSGITWNAKAMNNPYMFSGATLFGAGEAGDEILYGRKSLMNDIRNAVNGGAGNRFNITMNISGADDPSAWGEELVRTIQRKVRME